MFAFGSIVLTRFPFTELSGAKRPALVVSCDNERRSADRLLYHLYAARRSDMALFDATPGAGLKLPSVVRFDKLAMLNRGVIAGKMGEAPAQW